MPRSSSITSRITEFPAFLILLAILITGPLWVGGVSKSGFAWLSGLSGALLLLHGIILALRPSQRQLWLPPVFAAFIFCGYTYWGYARAEIEYVARLDWLMVMTATSIFLCVIQQFHRQSWIYAIIFTIILMGTGISIMAIIQYVTDSKMVWHYELPKQYWGRGSGSYICPNHLAGFLEMIIPISLSLALLSRLNMSLKIALIYASLVMLAGVVVSFSRGAWVSLAITLAIFAFFLVRRPHLRIATAAVAILLCSGLWFFSKTSDDIGERIDQTTLDSGEIEDIRFKWIWKPAVKIWQENLVFGIGPNHFDSYFPKYRYEDFQYKADRVHNDYLNTLVDQGIIGLLLVALPLILFGFKFSTIWKGNRRDQSGFGQKNSNKEPVFLGCCLGVFTMLIHSLVDFNLHIPANAILFTVIFAIAVSYWRHSTRRFWISPNWVTSAFQIIIFCGLGSYLMWNARILHASESALMGARKAQDPDSRYQLLLMGNEIDPKNYKILTLLGEYHRKLCFEGGNDYLEQKEKAIDWLDKAIEANPLHYYAYLRAGMAYAYTYENDKAETYFNKAVAIDPNGYFTQGILGWYYLMVDDLERSKKHLERSKKLKPVENELVEEFLPLVLLRLEESDQLY